MDIHDILIKDGIKFSTATAYCAAFAFMGWFYWRENQRAKERHRVWQNDYLFFSDIAKTRIMEEGFND